MLEVMSAGSAGLSAGGHGNRGSLLNAWDKSSPLIRELERTVNFAERKCGDLMQQLHFYKEYYEKWAQVEHVNHLCHKEKLKLCRQEQDDGNSSGNEFEKANQYLYKKIKNKIDEMNYEITETNRKIQSRKENFSIPDKIQSPQLDENSLQKYDPFFLTIENKTCKSEPTMTSSDVYAGDWEGTNVTGKQSSKSVPVRTKGLKNIRKESAFSKRRFSCIQRYKLRSKSLPQGVRRKFGFGGFFEVFEHEKTSGGSVRSRSKSKISLKAESLKSSKSRKSKTRIVEIKRFTPKSSQRGVKNCKSEVRNHIRNEKYEPEANNNKNLRLTNAVSRKSSQREGNACKAVVPSEGIPEVTNAEVALNNNLKTLMVRPNSLLPFLRNPIPFIPCSSTSKSFNLGLNVQQVLSLIKRKRHSVTLQAMVRNSMQAARSLIEPAMNTLFISQTTTSHSHVTSAICPARKQSEDSFSFVTPNRSQCSILKQVQTMRAQALGGKIASPKEPTVENTKFERPEDVWVVEQPDPVSKEERNSRSRCTCFPSKHCVDYHKVLRQYTAWRLPGSSGGDARSSVLCPKSKLYTVPSRDSLIREENDGRVELTKVHNDLHNLTRKYSSLQEQISQNCSGDYDANAELDAMESELAVREIEFKDILNFYNQLMVLKEKLKSLRARSGQNQRAPGFPRPKKDPLRPTPSMALAKALKKIQGLQDKIKLIDAP